LSTQTIYKEANADLIDQCKKGRNEAFKELYGLYSKAMFNVSMRMLNNKNEAEDVLQESFLSAFKNIKQYNGNGSFGSWLKRIVINRSLDEIKKRNVRFISIDDKDIAEEETWEEDAGIYNVDAVVKGISLLPDGYRVILSLYLFEDFSHKMIAEKLNISEGTSKSQYSRAKKKLVELITLKNKHHER
jgi:RNA polymerase sigma factor (sigma-70 family)